MLTKIDKSKKYVLSEGEEKLLAMASEATDGYNSVFSMLNNADLNLTEAKFQGKTEKITHGGYGVVLHRGNAEERKEWFEKYYAAYIRIIHALAQTYYGNVKKDVFFCRARGLQEQPASRSLKEQCAARGRLFSAGAMCLSMTRCA